MWQKGTFPAPADPAHDLVRTPRTECLNEACKKIENTSCEGRERSYTLVEHTCTFAPAHFDHVAQDHSKRLSKRLLVHPRSQCKMQSCKRMHASTCFYKKNASYRLLRGVVPVFVRAIWGENGLVVDPATRCTALVTSAGHGHPDPCSCPLPTPSRTPRL